METEFALPTDAYIASQRRAPWMTGRWSASTFDWLAEIAPNSNQKERLVVAVANLYEQTLTKPGRDYRLAWLPHFSDLFRFSTGATQDPSSEEAADWIHDLLLERLLPIAPYSAEAIKAEVENLWGGHMNRGKSLEIGWLLSNPNADPQWVAEQWEQYISDNIMEKLGSGSALHLFEGIAQNPNIGEGLVREIVRRSPEHFMRPLEHLLWNPALTADLAAELLPSHVQNPGYEHNGSRELLWRGNVPTFRTTPDSDGFDRRIRLAASLLEPLRMGKDMEIANREIHNARTEVFGWMDGWDNPVGYTRPDLTRDHTLEAFLSTPWTTEVHMRELDEVIYREKYEELRVSIAKALIYIYSPDPENNSSFSPLSKGLSFVAARFAQMDELDTAMGNPDVPAEWLMELL